MQMGKFSPRDCRRFLSVEWSIESCGTTQKGCAWKGQKMNNIAGLAIFASGIVLLIFGFNESQPVTTGISRAIAERSADKALWLIIGGAAAVIGGLVLAIRSRRT